MEQKTYRYRHLARVVIEAVTPITVGTGDKDFITDSPVLKDVNGLPYIPGTSIAGVIRHAIGHSNANDWFGYNDPENPADSLGSKIIFSNALMVGADGKVIEGLTQIDFDDSFYKHFKTLPIRQHNSIDSKGTVKKTGKFDEQVVYKGCRFCFEIEMVSETYDDENFDKVIATLRSNELRFGGGTRTGFGEIKIVSLQEAKLNLEKEAELNAYINKSSSLNEIEFWKDINPNNPDNQNNSKTTWTKYELELKPDDFFLFGSGLGSDDADMTPVRESVITWDGDKPKFETEYVLIPATSVKGAISHRVAFHYNRLEGVHADSIFAELKSELAKENLSNENFNKKLKEKYEEVVGENNIAVKELFGTSREKCKKSDNRTKKNEEYCQSRGNVILSDILIEKKNFMEKLINHVSIDRFTGGAIDGALFQEEVIFGNDYQFRLDILVNNKTYSQNVIKAFDCALKDITTGMLPLGGGVNRGHGSFSGVVLINGEPINE